MPLLMLLILLVIQFAIWENAESIAHATAEEALAAARVQGGTAAAGQQRAAQVIAQIGSSVLVGPQVSVTMTPADVTVKVTGTAERVLPVPGLSFPVTVTVTGPAERFVPLAAGRAVAWSAGAAPAGQVNPAAVTAMAEAGIDITAEFPKPWAGEFWQAADMVVTMGCGDACPLVPGKQYEDWELDDPDGKTLEQVRVIRDQVRDRVTGLLGRLGIPA